VAHATMDLMNHMRSISEFRKKIEDDLSTDEVYSRLATLFEKQLHFRAFVIYEVDKMDAMRPVYFNPQSIEEYLPDLTISSRCRAKRTGAMVSSVSDPHICSVCTFSDCLNHICIPMLAGGQVLGVIQLIAPIFLDTMVTDELNHNLHIAKNYIEEALPVIQAKRLARELEEMATNDQLTGLYNRRYLELGLDQIIAGIKRRDTRLGILMCDMDFFKEVNDTHGHDAGDMVLTNLAAILQESVRESDIVIRFGGEEFLILLVDVDENQTPKVAEKIRAAVEDYTFQLPGTDIKKTLSIGTAEFPYPGVKGVWEVIKQADVALYKAKDSGRNQVVVFSPELWPEKSY
jgi:two-component system cell cycle response regulator